MASTSHSPLEQDSTASGPSNQQSSMRHARSILNDLFRSGHDEDDEEEPFEIKRKLLRRRHVRKEQIRAKRRREETKNLTAKANVAITEEKVRQQLEPQIQQHKRKRTIVHAPSKRLKLEMKRTDTAAIITPKSSPKLLTSRRRLVDKFNESVDPNVLCLATLVSSSMNHKLKVQLHGDRHRTPPFSPVRPSSKYHHRKRLLR